VQKGEGGGGDGQSSEEGTKTTGGGLWGKKKGGRRAVCYDPGRVALYSGRGGGHVGRKGKESGGRGLNFTCSFSLRAHQI